MKGFTLIEMLISIALVGFMVVIGTATFNTTSRRERVNGGAQRVRQALLQAKANAQAGVKDCGACGAAGGVCGRGDRPLLGWRVVLTANTPPTPDVYEVEGLCGALPYPAPGWIRFYYRRENLPVNVEMTVSGALNSVLFRPAGGGIYPLPPMPAPPPVWSRSINFGYAPEPTKSVTVDSAGGVR